MSQYIFLKQVLLPINSTIRINRHLYCFEIVIALDNLCITYMCSQRELSYAYFLKFTLMLNHSNIKKEKYTFFLHLIFN